MTDEGLKHLSHLEKLELLWLNETKVSDAGIDDIAQLEKLWFIDLTDTLVTVEGRQKLRAALPSSGVHPSD